MRRRQITFSRRARLGLGTLLALGALTTTSYLAAGGVLAQSVAAPTAITPQLASEVAARAVTQMAGAATDGTLATLAKSTPGQATLISGLDSRFGVYYVPFLSGPTTIGYVAVAASPDQAPIVRISTGDLFAKATAKQAQVEAVAGQAAVSHELRWVDGFTQIAVFHFADGGTLDADLSSDRIGAFSPDLARPLPFGAAVTSAHAQWAALSSGPSTSPLTALAAAIAPTTAKADPTSQQVLAPFPNYEWYRGCAPTAGFMVEAYWSMNGRPTLMQTTDYVKANSYTGNGVMNTPTPGTKPYIDQLASDMSTAGDGGTMLSNIASGLNSYASQHGYSNTTAEVTNGGYSQLVSWISQKHPVVGSFLQWAYYSPTGTMYNGYRNNGQRIDHSVAVHGFQYSDVHGQFMVLRDDATEDGDNYVAWDLAPTQDWASDQLDAPWY